MRIRVIALVASASAIIGSLAGVGAALVWDGGNDNTATAPPASTSAAPSNAELSQSTSLGADCLAAADIYQQVRPSVVRVTSAAARSEGTGTGVVIDTEGRILTNNHVIDGAQTIEVQFDDGSTLSAEIVGTDPANDLAVIQADPAGHNLVAAALGDSDALRVGDPVLAIGNPFNLEGTLTQGIVSAINRTYSTGANTRPIRDMIQTDAAVNPGNSGGPLLNCQGEVVGINSLLENPTGQSVNVGVAFAVAINTAKNSMPELVAGQTVDHPWLGIAGVDVTPALAEQLHLTVDKGVYVTLVSPGAPADDAGLQAAFRSESAATGSSTIPSGGDVILKAGGNEMTSIDELAAYLDKEKKPGDPVELLLLRDGKELTVTAQLAQWPG